MKQSLLAFLLLLMQFSFAQDCTTRAAARPSASVRFPDIYTSAVSDEKKPASWDISRIKPLLAKTESWVKNLLTGFTGAKLAYSNNYFLDNYKFGGAAGSAFYKATGIKGCYSAKMRFYQYYC
ncbi:MAG: hypothetical protein ACXWB9_03945, partial [Flavisolibacter sp.]